MKERYDDIYERMCDSYKEVKEEVVKEKEDWELEEEERQEIEYFNSIYPRRVSTNKCLVLERKGINK